MLKLGESPGQLGHTGMLCEAEFRFNLFFQQVVWKWQIFSEVKIRGILTSDIYSLKFTVGEQGI